MDLYSDIKTKVSAAGLSMREVCEEAGVSSGTPTHWKSGRTAPNQNTYNRMIKAVDTLVARRAVAMRAAGIPQAA
jgi:transcriptional regulator with XRE-family HTH domain